MMICNTLKCTSVFLFMLIGYSAFGQSPNISEEEAIKEVIKNLFDGMRSRDTALMAEQFLPGAGLQSAVEDDLQMMSIRSIPLKRWLDNVAQPRPEIFDERILGYKINLDDNLAQVWTPYQFYLGERFSHCGANAFQLVKTKDGWKIFSVIDTKRKTDCPE